MDIAVARTFLEILKTGSFVAAAANLNITQTAVSARIRGLEEQLGRPLFIRSRVGAKLTPAGQQFHRFAATLVQVWESAERAVVMPVERDQVVTLGAELSLWSPLTRDWLLWMRRECPSIGINARIDNAERLIEQVQDGSLDGAVVYGARRRSGLITELLFEERLIRVRAVRMGHELETDDHVGVFWGDDFEAGYRAAFPDEPRPMVSIGYGPLALDYILAAGGSGYFREGFVKPYLDEGLVAPMPESPQFSYSASLVHSTRAEEGMIDTIRSGLRAAVALSA
jgi:DNA-binding transcriptional LysR family regulator